MLHSPKTWLVVFSFFIAAACGSHAFADGKYFGQATIARDPTIPSQRAIICWRDGQQTMIIESLVEGDGDEIAWIIPLPAIPTSIQPASAGLLRTASELITPVVHGTRSGDDWMHGGLALLAISSPIFLALISYSQNKYGNLARVGGVLLAAVVLVGLFLPALAKARGGMEVTGIRHVSSQTVGSYEVAVIESGSGDAAKRWLNENGFRCDETATSVLNQYATDGWCFAAARIRTSGEGAMRPHPMKFTFATQQPIYPMRLTGLTSEPLVLDLFVISDKTAESPLLKQWFSDTFLSDVHQHSAAGELSRSFQATGFNADIGHPGLVALLWENCVLTHLRGTLTPEQMRHDVVIDWAEAQPIRHHVYAAKTALQRAVGICLISLAASLFIVGIARHLTQSWTRGVVRLALALLAACVVLSGISYAQCDVQPVTESREWIKTRLWPRKAMGGLADLKSEIGERPVTEELLNESLLKTAATFAADPMEFLRNRNVDTPNGYEIERNDDSFEVIIYDAIGAPASIRFNAVAPSSE